MKNELNRAFSTLDTLTLIGSILVVALVIGPILSRRINQEYALEAARLAKDWSEKIPLDEKLSVAGLGMSSQRDVASGEGSVPKAGLDPWGRPYNFKFIRNSYGQPTYLAVWSSGPNAKDETPQGQLIMSPEGRISAQFGGDDVGHVRALR